MFSAEVNGRLHRVTRRAPAEMLEVERQHLHRVPDQPYTAAFGVTRKVPENTPMVSHDWCQYSVPHELVGETVWVREEGDDDIVIVHVGPKGAKEVARHRRTVPGQPRIAEEHFPPRDGDPLDRTPRPQNPAEAAFLAIGPGAVLWLKEAAQAGTRRVRAKMDQAVELARIYDAEAVDWALGHAAVSGRFGEGDLASILARREARRETSSASETHSLQGSTRDWEGFGR